MTTAQLHALLQQKQSYLCVGLDTDIEKLPAHLPKTVDGLLRFNEAIVRATAPYALAYKVNTAFYEALGAAGWLALQATAAMLPSNCYKIADAKRGDIGNTSALYARAFFEQMPFDAVTVSPYMGHDSLQPFLGFGKQVIVLGLTSNPGSQDVQQQVLASGRRVYEETMQRCAGWASPEELLFVVGATKPDEMAALRQQYPDYWFLVPGVGAQGGDLTEVSRAGMSASATGGKLLVNNSRGIIYASSGPDFAEAAGQAAAAMQAEMTRFLAGN